MSGALVGIRTRDLILTKNVLCLLSYKGTFKTVAEATVARNISYTLAWRSVIQTALIRAGFRRRGLAPG